MSIIPTHPSLTAKRLLIRFLYLQNKFKLKQVFEITWLLRYPSSMTFKGNRDLTLENNILRFFFISDRRRFKLPLSVQKYLIVFRLSNFGKTGTRRQESVPLIFFNGCPKDNTLKDIDHHFFNSFQHLNCWQFSTYLYSCRTNLKSYKL